ncbi:MAG: flagellar protein [Oscillospiraceae bacterium]|nr:flagellar protein [Oscillospiraceae bacterium]
MDIKSCRTCGKMFQYRGSYQCPDCMRALDEKFVEVRNYILDNPSAAMADICEENDVDQDTVMRWIREGRLLMSGSAGGDLHFQCRNCGKKINGGTYCFDCSNKLKSQIDGTARDLQRSIDKLSQEKHGIHTQGLRRK